MPLTMRWHISKLVVPKLEPRNTLEIVRKFGEKFPNDSGQLRLVRIDEKIGRNGAAKFNKFRTVQNRRTFADENLQRKEQS